MGMMRKFLKPLVAASLIGLPVSAQERDLDELFDALRDADPQASERIAARIWEEWSKSGSPAMDLLLDRARGALEDQDYDTAIGHTTAVIDHSPDFAEAYNLRATALFNAGRYGPALEDIRMALALNPRHFGAMTGLAIIMGEMGEDDLALRAWREVERLYPQHEALDRNLDRLERRVEGMAL